MKNKKNILTTVILALVSAKIINIRNMNILDYILIILIVIYVILNIRDFIKGE